MKILRDIAAGLEANRQNIALENDINDMLDFAETLPQELEIAPNLSLESVMKHLRPLQVRERFSIKALALENESGLLVLAMVSAVVVALVVAISKFINWLFPSGKRGSGGESYASMSPSQKSDHFTIVIKRNVQQEKLWKDIDDKLKASRATADKNFEQTLRDADALAQKMRKQTADAKEAKAAEEAAKKAERDRVYVTNVNMIVQEWLKSAEGKDSRTVDFLNNAPMDYYNIADRGIWYTCAEALIPAMTNLDALVIKRADAISTIDAAVTALAGGGFKEEVHVKAISDAFAGPLMITVGGKQQTLMQAFERLQHGAEAAREEGQRRGMHFTSMVHNFSDDAMLSKCGHIAGEVGRANTHLHKLSDGLERVQTHLKAIESGHQTDEHKVVVVELRRAMDILRRDIMGHVKLCHQMMLFVDRVNRMNSDLLHAERTILGVIKKYVKPGEESDVRDFDWAMKRFDEINTIDL
jgi:hypothetical protein